MMKRTFVSGRTSAALVAAVVLAGCIGTTRPPATSTVPAMPAAGLQVYAVGDIADCNHRAPADSMAARTSRLVPDGALVLGLGDMAYPLSRRAGARLVLRANVGPAPCDDAGHSRQPRLRARQCR